MLCYLQWVIEKSHWTGGWSVLEVMDVTVSRYAHLLYNAFISQFLLEAFTCYMMSAHFKLSKIGVKMLSKNGVYSEEKKSMIYSEINIKPTP